MRTLMAAALVVAASSAWLPVATAAAQSGVFVPAPKGSGESLDSSPAAATAGPGGVHQVSILCGDRITGRVLTIDSAGKIRLTAPHFAGEVTVLASAVDTVALNGRTAEGKDELQLTNGDRLRGEIVSITPSEIQIDTPAAGSLKVKRMFVRAVRFGQGATVLVDSDFAKGLAPWANNKASNGDQSGWVAEDGNLVCHAIAHVATLWTKIEQKEAVTLVCNFTVPKNIPVSCSFILFAESNENNTGTNSVFSSLVSSQEVCDIQYAKQCYPNEVTRQALNRDFRGGTVRFAYDPETGKAHLWIDEQDKGECLIPTKPTSGKYVMVNTQEQIKVEQLLVLRGVVGPDGTVVSTGAVGSADKTTVQFANQDRVAAQAISLADGRFVIMTSRGELKCPMEEVQRIIFGRSETEVPRRQKGDVRVELGTSRLTLQFDQLTADALLGRSDALGEVKINRAAVRTITFNIYRDGGRVPPAVPVPAPPPVIDTDGDEF